MPSRGGIELTQCHARASYGPASSGVHIEPPIRHPGKIHDNALAHVAAAHPAAGASRSEWYPVVSGPTDQPSQVFHVGRQADREREDAIDPRGLRVGGTSPQISAIDAPDVGRRQHRPKLTIFSLMAEVPRAQLIHIDVDRRLGHEWDKWDGRPLPNQGNYDSPPALFFAWSAITLVVILGLLAVALFLLAPRIRGIHQMVPGVLWSGLLAAGSLLWVWWALLFLSHQLGRPLLPERLAERGPFLRLMRLTSRIADRFGRRDWVENAAVKVYNGFALMRGRKVGQGELLLLIPRCLSKATLDGVLGIAGKYGVPVFVATRGQLARRVIRERRPRAVVAVACERDMVSGLHDVAGKIPVLGLTMTLPAGPCKDASLDLGQLEQWVRAYVV
jgi:uncharacterized protein